MKIMQISASSGTFGVEEGKTQVSLTLETDLSPTEAISSVLALFTGEREHGTVNVAGAHGQHFHNPAAIEGSRAAADRINSGAPDVEANVTDEPAKVTRPRRPRTNPDAASASAAADAPAAQDAPTDAPAAGVRRRRTVEVPAADAPKVITDADLTKAASNAAAIIGTEVVQAVLDEFKVGTVSDIAPELREKFLGELDIEIDLAKKELAKAGA